MIQWRITKYDPAFRDERGSYTCDEWTFFAQVGTRCGGKVLTMEEYIRVETAYLDVALAFAREAKMTDLRSLGVQRSWVRSIKVRRRLPGQGANVPISDLREVVRRILREEFWCRLEGSRCYMHFGWDYYMYIAASRDCPAARARAHSMGLFVEEFESPYLTSDE